jgi:hypothetical protein
MNVWKAIEELNKCLAAYELAMAVGDVDSALTIADEVFRRWAALDLYLEMHGLKETVSWTPVLPSR